MVFPSQGVNVRFEEWLTKKDRVGETVYTEIPLTQKVITGYTSTTVSMRAVNVETSFNFNPSQIHPWYSGKVMDDILKNSSQDKMGFALSSGMVHHPSPEPQTNPACDISPRGSGAPTTQQTHKTLLTQTLLSEIDEKYKDCGIPKHDFGFKIKKAIPQGIRDDIINKLKEKGVIL